MKNIIAVYSQNIPTIFPPGAILSDPSAASLCFYDLVKVLVQALRKARQRSDEDLFSGAQAASNESVDL